LLIAHALAINGRVRHPKRQFAGLTVAIVLGVGGLVAWANDVTPASAAAASSALSFATKTVPWIIAQNSYSRQLKTSGGVKPLTWSLSSGALPPGINLYPGKLSGVPTKAGKYSFTVTVKDSETSPESASQAYTLVVYRADRLVSGSGVSSTLNPGQALHNGRFELLMQSADGNLVDYVTQPNGQVYPIWATGTTGWPDAYAIMGPTGDFQVIPSDPSNPGPLWASDTGSDSAPPNSPDIVTLTSNGNVQVTDDGALEWQSGVGPAQGDFPTAPAAPAEGLTAGQGLFGGQQLVHGAYTLLMQSDGNLVEYKSTDGQVSAVWASGTAGYAGDWVVMQPDGNLVVYNVFGSAIWASGTTGNPGARFKLRSGGKMVIVSGNTRIWTVVLA
jgi:hypothetical protein